MGLTRPRAYQIFDIDYKQSVRVVTVSNVTLSGGAPSQVDGVTLSLNDRVLVTGQSTGSQNGLYYVTTVGTGSNGTWARSIDGNETGEIEAGMIVMVTEGTTYADTQWKLTTNDPIVIGSTALTFVLNVQANSISSGTSNVVVNANANVTISSAGTANVFTVSSTGTVTSGTASVTGNINSNGAVNINSTDGMYNVLNITGTALGPYGGSQTWKFFTQNAVPGGPGSWVLFPDSSLQTTAYPGSSTALSLSANVTGGNLISNAQVTASGNITGGNILTGGIISATGNATVGNIAATIGTFTTFTSAQGGTITGTLVATSANAQFFNQTNGAGYITVAGYLSAVGNVTGGNLITAGLLTATGNITGGNVLGGVLYATNSTANAVTARLTTGTDSNFRVTAQNGVSTNTTGTEVARVGLNYVGTGWDSFTQYIRGSAAQNGAQVLWASNTAIANINSTGMVVTGIVSASGNITGGNILTSGLTSVTGNVTGGNITTAGQVTATANITGGNITTAGQITATANITGGNLLTVGQISSTGTITTAAGTNSTGFAVGNGAVSNVGLGFFPTAGTRGDYAIRDYSSVFSTMYLDVGIGGSAGGEFQFRTGNTYSLSMRANSSGVYSSGVVSATGIVYGSELNSTNSQVNEGGQINLALPSSGSTLSTSVIIDVYQNRLRFFEGGGTARGAYIDLTSCSAGAATNLLAGGGGGTPGGSNTYVQFNDSGAFGGNGQFVYDKVTNTLTTGIIAANNNGTGQNFKVGDDIWIGDINAADTMRLTGQQNGANAYIVFGNADGAQLGRAGTGPLTYAGAFSATGNITGGNILGGANVNATTHTGTTVSVTGNITGGNVLTGGLISAAGTITGSTFSGAGTNLTGTASSLTVGTATTAGTVTTAAQPNITSVGTLSSLSVTANVQGGNLRTAGLVSATGNITGGGLVGTLYTNSIINTGANATGNIGSSTLYFNTVFAKATSAQYADLAEMYVSDQDYPPGTVVEFGGKYEITSTTENTSTRVAGIVSTNPSYLMNSAQPGEHVLPIALTGRVPCFVKGPVRKGDVLVSSDIPGVAQRIGVNWQPGCTVGKAMEVIEDQTVAIIEVAVGRL